MINFCLSHFKILSYAQKEEEELFSYHLATISFVSAFRNQNLSY